MTVNIIRNGVDYKIVMYLFVFQILILTYENKNSLSYIRLQSCYLCRNSPDLRQASVNDIEKSICVASEIFGE
jgi:hypothetical protein